MEVKKYIFGFFCVLVLFVTACSSDDIMEEERAPRQSEVQGYGASVTADVRVIKDEVVVRVDTAENKRIRSNNQETSSRRRK